MKGTLARIRRGSLRRACRAFALVSSPGPPVRHPLKLRITATVDEAGPLPRGTLPDIIHHHAPRGLPQAALDLTPSASAATDVDLCARLIEAYARATRLENTEIDPTSRPNEGVWEMITHEYHGRLSQLLQNGDAAALAAYLRNGLRSEASHGLGPGAQVFTAAANAETAPTIAAIIVDRLIALAEALAILPCENPEQGGWGQNLYEDLEKVIGVIEERCGHAIGTPRVFGNFGIATGDSLINVRTPDNLYTTHRMSVLLNGLAQKSVLEIGAGFGGTAYYAVLRGVRQFTIVDLPVMNVLQGFFLIKSLGWEAVTLFGERSDAARVRMLPYWEISRFERGQFDLAMNQDSLPEIPLARAREYLENIPRFTKQFFYSINQEALALAGQRDLRQLVVPWLVEAYPAYRRIARHPYWLRRGYVEEVYELV